MSDKNTVKISEVGGGSIALHSQIAVAEVVIRSGLQLVGSHDEEPTTDHDQPTNQSKQYALG